SNELSELLADSAAEAGGMVHRGGSLVIIEGPRFSTRGESEIYRQWGCSIIGMTSCPEAFLAREAEIAYATIAHVTDYDVWHTSEEPVTAEKVMATMSLNLATVQKAIVHAVASLDTSASSEAHTVLDDAIMVYRSQVPDEILDALGPIVARRFANQP